MGDSLSHLDDLLPKANVCEHHGKNFENATAKVCGVHKS